MNQTWLFVVKAIGPDLKCREPVTGSLDLQSGNLTTHGELLPPEVKDELLQFRPGAHEGNAWDVTTQQFVYRIRFEPSN